MNQKGQILHTRAGMVLVAIFAAIIAIAPSSARADLKSAGIDLGKATKYVILGTEQGIVLGKGLQDQTNVNGNVGLYNSELTLGSNVTVNGTIYYSSPARTPINGPAGNIKGGTQTGTAVKNDLLSAIDSSKAASKTAAAKKSTAGYASNYDIKGNLTLNGTGNVVLNLGFFIIRNNATLTLTGTATTSYVINISQQFLLSMGHLVLSGGLTSDNVLFNIGSGVKTASIIKGSSFQGTLLALNSTIEVADGSTVKGRLIGRKVTLTGNPPVVSP